jgi:hypothetical protein
LQFRSAQNRRFVRNRKLAANSDGRSPWLAVDRNVITVGASLLGHGDFIAQEQVASRLDGVDANSRA